MSQISKVPADHGCEESIMQGYPGVYAHLTVFRCLVCVSLLVGKNGELGEIEIRSRCIWGKQLTGPKTNHNNNHNGPRFLLGGC